MQTDGHDMILRNPATGDTVPLTLAVGRGGGRSWRVQRVPRRVPRVEGAGVESQLEWMSWHSGDGFGRSSTTGVLPPVAAEGNLDNRYSQMMTLPPRMHAIAGVEDASLVFYHVGYVWAVGKEGSNWKLYRIDPTTETVVETDLGTTGTPESATKFDGSVWIGRGSGANVVRVDNAGAVSAAVDNAVRWGQSVVGLDELWFAVDGQTLQSVASGANPFYTGDWSGPLVVGDDGVSIRSLEHVGRVNYIGRDDGVVAFDQSLNLNNMLPDLKDVTDDENTIGMRQWHGYLLVPHVRGLFLLNEGFVTPSGSERIKTNTTGFRGHMRAFASDGEWVWALMHRHLDDDYSYSLVVGRERMTDESGEGPIAWFEIERWTQADPIRLPMQMSLAMVSGSPRLYFPKSDTLVWIGLSADGGPPTNAGTGDFEAAGEKVLPVLNAAQPLVPKHWRSVEVDVQNNLPDDMSRCKVYYAVDPDGAPSWSLLGTVTTDGRHELELEGITGFDLHVKVRLERDEDWSELTTESPVIRRVAVSYSERPERNRVITATCEMALGTQMATGVENPEDAAAIIDQLEAWLNGATPLELDDPAGRTYAVQLVGMEEDEIQTRHMDGKPEPVMRVQLTMVRVSDADQ